MEADDVAKDVLKTEAEKMLQKNYTINQETGRLNQFFTCKVCSRNFKIRCNAIHHLKKHLKKRAGELVTT